MKSIKVIYDNGTVSYLNQNGQCHREDGPAVVYSCGFKAWFINDKLHREDGPAIEYSNGDKSWYQNGKRHREDGPAVVYSCGDKYWYINGKELSEQEFNNRYKVELTLEEIATKFNIPIDKLKIKK